jgi:hypothetical protein
LVERREKPPLSAAEVEALKADLERSERDRKWAQDESKRLRDENAELRAYVKVGAALARTLYL